MILMVITRYLKQTLDQGNKIRACVRRQKVHNLSRILVYQKHYIVSYVRRRYLTAAVISQRSRSIRYIFHPI